MKKVNNIFRNVDISQSKDIYRIQFKNSYGICEAKSIEELLDKLINCEFQTIYITFNSGLKIYWNEHLALQFLYGNKFDEKKFIELSLLDDGGLN